MLPNEWGFVHSEHYFNLAFQKAICKVVSPDKEKFYFPSTQEKDFQNFGKIKREK